MKAIETAYRGYRFRSRLETRWAVFMDALGVDWRYEPEGYNLGPHGLYLPDFFCRFAPEWKAFSEWPDPGKFVEVKPTLPTPDDLKSVIGRKLDEY